MVTLAGTEASNVSRLVKCGVELGVLYKLTLDALQFSGAFSAL